MTEAEMYEWAKKNNKLQGIFTRAIKVGEIDEGEVFELATENDEPVFIGLPTFYIVKGNRLTEVFGEESLEVISKLDKNADTEQK
jgi:hypothetical protein